MLPLLCFTIRQAEEIVGRHIEISGESNNVAAGDFLYIVFVFTHLLLSGIQQLGYFLLTGFPCPRFFQPCTYIHYIISSLFKYPTKSLYYTQTFLTNTRKGVYDNFIHLIRCIDGKFVSIVQI